MGIINLTPDSFSDGGDFNNIEKALDQIKCFINHGVDIIDLGAQSTRPGAIEVGSEIELVRLLPTLREIKSQFPNLLISIDTFHSDVAYEALTNGADWINDVTGGRRDERIFDVVSEFNCPFVITHSRGNSQNMNDFEDYDNLISDIVDELKFQTERALKKKIKNENIIWDPGIGFSKNTLQNIFILKNLNEIKKFGYPLMIGASRKRFIGDILSIKKPKERDIGSLAISCLCSQMKIEIIRVHNVKFNYQILKVADKIYRED